MPNTDSLSKYLNTAASLIVLTALTANAHAIDRYAVDGSMSRLVDSSNDCVETIGGRTGLCGAPMDTDGDGVTDDKDKCPTTPKGVSVNSDGCALDTDGDGVADYKDKCPASPAGATVNSDGCQVDSDGDGVYDAKDHCPKTPAGAKVDNDGCMESLVLNNVQFETNSAQLTMDAKAILNPIAGVLKGRPDIKALSVTGHTDSRGSEAYNQRLSQARAQSVADFFTSAGVSTQISATGMGESAPVADNGNSQGRAQNRRVELDIMK